MTIKTIHLSKYQKVRQNLAQINPNQANPHQANPHQANPNLASQNLASQNLASRKVSPLVEKKGIPGEKHDIILKH